MKTVMGIDNGTQSTKVVIYDYENKEILAVGQAPHDLKSEADGTREQEADWWITALKTAMDQLPADLRKTVEAIGVSGQQHGFVPVDEKGEVLYPVKLWCDTSTAGECTELTEAYGGDEALLKGPGNLVLAGYTISKILWLKKNHPAIYAKMAHILLPHDYLNFWLTGRYTMEWGDASGTGFLNIAKRKWDTDLIKLIDGDRDLTECLPELIQPFQPSGILQADRAKELGLPAGIPVSAGGGDNMMGAIGTGTVSEGVLTISLGTSGTLYGYSDKPVIDPDGNLAAFCSSTGGWLPLLCTMNCTVATELTRKLFDLSVRDFEDIAQKAPAGAEGVITLPFFNGERIPNFPNGRGNIMGLTNGNMTQPNVFRSAMEAAIYGLKIGLESFRKLGFQATEIRLIGGGANSPFWSQMTADILELPVKIPTQKEAAAFGSALQALWMKESSQGNQVEMKDITDAHITLKDTVYQPDSSLQEAYRKGFDEYQSYVKALTDLFS